MMMVNKRKPISFNDLIFGIFNTLIMITVTIITFYPFLYMLFLSFSGGDTYAKVLLWPEGFTTVAYDLMINKIKFLDSTLISILRSTVGPVCTLFVIFMGAYALSHHELIWRKFLTRLVVFAMYFSAGLLPVYLNISDLKLTGTFFVYILPGLVNVFELLLIRTFIQEMPRSLEESAVIDGANDLQAAFRIVLPLCLPVLGAVALFEFVGQWNAYGDTLLYNYQNPELFTLQYSLSNYLSKQLSFSPTDFTNKSMMQNFNLPALRMAMTVIVCVPVVIVYPFLQKYFVKGILVGSMKG